MNLGNSSGSHASTKLGIHWEVVNSDSAAPTVGGTAGLCLCTHALFCERSFIDRVARQERCGPEFGGLPLF